MKKVLYIFVNNKSIDFCQINGDAGDVVESIDADAVDTDDLEGKAYAGYDFFFVTDCENDCEKKTLQLYNDTKLNATRKNTNMYIVYMKDLTDDHVKNEKHAIDYNTLYVYHHRKLGDRPGNYSEVLNHLKCKVDKSGHRTVLSTFVNYEEILLNDTTMRDRCRYNKLTGLIECNEKWYDDENDYFGELGLIKLLSYFSRNYGLDNKKYIEMALTSVAKRYNPVTEMMDKMVWDGKDRLHECMCRLLGCEDNWYTWVVCCMMMFGFVNRAYEPGCDFQLVPVLYGKQGLGKGSFCSYFSMGRDSWYATIKPEYMVAREKETGEKLAGRIVVEIEEMTMSDASDKIADIKGFLSRKTETYRDAYARGNATDHKRSCIFIATSNNDYPLPADPTGARRYMSIRCVPDKIDQSLSAKSHYHDAQKYFLQVIAQVVDMYKQGKTVTSIPEEAVEFCKLFMDEHEAKEYIKKSGMPERLRDTIEEMQMADQPRDGLAEAVAGYLEECITVNCVCIESVKEIMSHFGYNKASESVKSRKAGRIMSEMKGWEKSPKSRHCGKYVAVDTDGNIMDEFGKNGKMKSWGTQSCWIRTGSCGVNGKLTVENKNPKENEASSTIITFPKDRSKAEYEAKTILRSVKDGTYDFEYSSDSEEIFY